MSGRVSACAFSLKFTVNVPERRDFLVAIPAQQPTKHQMGGLGPKSPMQNAQQAKSPMQTKYWRTKYD